MELDIEQIDGELDGVVDPKYKEGMLTAVPSTWTIRGVRVPELKRIAKERSVKKKTGEDYLQIVDFVDEAFARRDRELAVVGINLLVPYKRFYDDALVGKTKEWITDVQDWEICDNLSYLVIHELLSADLFTPEDLLYLRDHDNVFARRAYLVCRVKSLRKGDADMDESLDDISYFVSDRDKYMVKAMSWVLREASKSAPEKVSRFIDEFGDELHPMVVREVTTKLETGKKN